jgi:transcriptional regulator with XRE-family HTH domain
MTKNEMIAGIKAEMKRKGISQKSLSEKTGLPQSNISRIFNENYDVNYTTLCRITNAIGCEIVLKNVL